LRGGRLDLTFEEFEETRVVGKVEVPVLQYICAVKSQAKKSKERRKGEEEKESERV